MVRDETRLTGRFDWDLEWAQAPTNAALPADGSAPQPLLGPTLAAALEQQLGLRLESRRGPVEILVIDSVERPQPN